MTKERQNPSDMGIFSLTFEYLRELYRAGHKSSYKGYSLSQLRTCDPEDFEQAVAEAWEIKGYATKVTSGGADMGVDVIAKSGDRRVAIQAKRYQEGNKVGVSTVREIVGSANQIGANTTVIVTTSSFTEPAKEAAEALDVELYNGDQIVRILAQVGD